jgi:hypothetical protein
LYCKSKDAYRGALELRMNARAESTTDEIGDEGILIKIPEFGRQVICLAFHQKGGAPKSAPWYFNQ